jgi:hypothetical protein
MTKRTVGDCAIVVCFALLAWILFSYADIVTHNLTTANYAWWNIINLFLKGG